MKPYMVVLKIGEGGDKEVRRIFLSEMVNETNIQAIVDALSQKWLLTSKQFPAPQFDIALGICDDLKNVEREIPRSHGWDAVHIEPLFAQAQF